MIIVRCKNCDFFIFAQSIDVKGLAAMLSG